VSFERLAQLRLQQAIDEGLLENLPNCGERLDLDEYFATPQDVRLAYSILRNAHCLPEEVEIRNEVAALERARSASASPDQRCELGRRIAGLALRLDLLRDRVSRR
jgi:hypothetical protein